MKQTISIIMLGIAMMLASCSRDENALQTNEKRTVTFTATLDGGMNLRGTKTRGTDPTDEPVTRAVLEIYEYGTMVDDRIIGTISGDQITFTAELMTGKAYNCLFWADRGEDAYDIENLADIRRGANPSIAYCAAEEIIASADPIDVTLQHAVAKVVLHETGILNDGDKVGITFSMPDYSFNVFNRDVSLYGIEPTFVEITGSFDITPETTTGEIGSLYVFAFDGGETATMTLSYIADDGIEKTKEVSNVPLKLNYRTVLKGKFTEITEAAFTQGLSVTLDKEWEEDKDFYFELNERAEIGDYCYEDGLFSDTYYPALNCLGIVFHVDGQSGTSGKIVNLNETLQKYSTEHVATGATSNDDGLSNLATIQAISGWETTYPAFEWCTAQGDGWYLPALHELLQFFEVWNVDPEGFNQKLTTAGGTEVISDPAPLYKMYLTSTEADFNFACTVDFTDGNAESVVSKESLRVVRPIRRF